MRGIFREGDRVEVEEIGKDGIRTGDIVVYRSPSPLKRRVIHRVRFLDSRRVVTQGDNTLRPDPCEVRWKDVLSRVTGYERNGRYHKVANGFPGRVHALRTRLLLRLRRTVAPVIGPLYRVIGRWLVALYSWRPAVHSVAVTIPKGSILKYVHGSRTVATWNPRYNHWTCRKPYDLVLRKPQ